MELITPEMAAKIKDNIVLPFFRNEIKVVIANVPDLVRKFHSSIPENKRISYGIVHVVRLIGNYLFQHFSESGDSSFEKVKKWFDNSNDSDNTAVSMCILSNFGMNHYQEVLPYFRQAAASENWEIREIVQMFFRKLIKKYPADSKEFLLELVVNQDPNVRRFVAETLRPVVENKWFHKNPDYPVSIISFLFKEKNPYPRTSVGNNLSDLSRQNPELVFRLVNGLVESGDKNAYWIAYRACRNLVKREKERVLTLLKIKEYKYKDKIYRTGEN